MTLKPSIIEAMIRFMATSQSLKRGQDYYRAGAVLELGRRGNPLTAEVEGSDYEPDRMTVHLAEEGVSYAAGTCPYGWEGVCRHIVAVLLDKPKHKYSLTPRLRQLQ